MPNIDTLIVKCDAGVVDSLTASFDESEAAIESSPLRHLDGQQANDWIVLIGIAVQTAPQVLDALRRFLTRNNIRSVKFGGVEIENPRPEDVERLVAVVTSGSDRTR